MSSVRSLDQWLLYIEQQHTVTIDMGLDRVTTVARRLQLEAPNAHVITVAGTNGKGSTAVAMEQLLLGSGSGSGSGTGTAAQQRVGCTLSPHIAHFSERIRVQGQAVSDALICAAFAAIDSARAEVPLTYFEFATLAALWCFRAIEVDVMILEIGLGGRLDAFNLVSANTAVITSIGLDHQRFLGTDRDSIGAEKAGILRAGQRVCLGPDMPATVFARTSELGLAPLTVGRELRIHGERDHWSLDCDESAERASVAWQVDRLPASGFKASNVALALAATWPLLDDTQRRPATLRRWAATLALPGRCEQRVARARHWLLDVGHNVLAATHLLQFLRRRVPARRVVAVFGVLADKPALQMAQRLAPRVSHWVLVPTPGERGQSSATLAAQLPDMTGVHRAHSVAQGLRMARALTSPVDQILVWGSFAVVGEADPLLDRAASPTPV